VEVLANVGIYTWQLEYRTATTPPSVHKAQAELIYVAGGGCTLIMGGTLVNPKDNGGDNNGTGSSSSGHRLFKPVLSERQKNSSSFQDKGLPPPFAILSKDRKVLRSNKSCSFVTNVKFNPANTLFIMECGGPEVPYVGLYSPSYDGTSSKRLIKVQSISLQSVFPFYNLPFFIVFYSLFQVIQNNDALLNLSQHMAFPQIRIFPVVLSTGKTVQVRLLLPPGLREDEITQYPLIVNV
jgi:hypothetical protein